MARRKTRTHHTEPARPVRASYAELREAARMRRAARAARTTAQDTPRPAAGATAQLPDQQASRGISRRDFVSAGAVAVVTTAAAAPALFAQTTTPEAALDICISEMKKASTLPMGKGVEAWLRQHALGNFVKHIAEFDKNKDKVVEAARAIGSIASTLASLNESPTVENRHMHDAVAAVKPNCKVGAIQPRFVFCPDLPA